VPDGSRPGVSRGFELTPPADFNRDRHVDELDFDIFRACSAETAIAYAVVALPPLCPQSSDHGPPAVDLDLDGRIDQQDFGLFQRCMSGSLRTADVDCAK
jgi:hypothetical protein